MILKRILILLLVSLGLHSTTNAQTKKVVTSSASMIWDMVNNIAGDKVHSQLIVPIGGDPHIYDPSPADAQKVTKSDLIFVNGLTFEGWITELIDNSGTKAKTITVTDNLTPISSSVYKNAYDPHAWMDVSLAQTYIKSIKDGLVDLDPANAATYETNYKSYSQKLKELDAYIEKRIQEIPPTKRLLVTSHDAFTYYGKRYGMRVEGLMGISTESEAQTSDMIRIQKAIKSTGIPSIFLETTINPKLIKQIAADNNVGIGGSLYADSIGKKGSSGDSYYNMLKSNTDVIVDALKKELNPIANPQPGTGGSSFIAYGILALVMIGGLVALILKVNK